MPTEMPSVESVEQALAMLRQLESTSPEDLIRADGTLQNAMLSFGGENGVEADVEAYNKVGSECKLTPQQQESLFADDALCERVCSFMPQEMGRSGFGTDHKKNDDVLAWVEQVDLISMLVEASIYANIYDQGAGIVLGVEDGRDSSQPVDRTKIKSVKPLFVKGGRYLTPVWMGMTKPSYYTLSVATSEENISSTIHPDRVLWFPGIWVPVAVEQMRGGSPSLLSRFWRHYSRWEMANKIALNLMARISIVHYQQKGWTNLLAQTSSEAINEVRKRLEILKTMSTMGILISDLDNNKVEIVSRSLQEVSAILDRLEKGMLAASGMSRTDLLGTAESTGFSDDNIPARSAKANKILGEQDRYWKKPLKTAIEYWLLSQKQDPACKVTFDSTLTYTRQEQINEVSQISQALGGLIGIAVTQNEFRSILNKFELVKGEFETPFPQPEEPPQEEFVEEVSTEEGF